MNRFRKKKEMSQSLALHTALQTDGQTDGQRVLNL